MSDQPSRLTEAPGLDEMLGRYLARQADAPDAGDAFGMAVEPYEVAGGLRTDSRLAWREATALLDDEAGAAPAGWVTYADAQGRAGLLPMALGHFPQQVRDVAALVRAGSLAALARPADLSPTVPVELVRWAGRLEAQGRPAGLLLAAAVYRLVGRAADSARLLDRAAAAGGDWVDLAAIERGALAWSVGNSVEAVGCWQALGDRPAALFNRALAALDADRPAEARDLFRRAADGLDEDGSWHHLARMLAALADVHA